MPQVVQVEIVWVMKSAYQLEKSVIVKILAHLDNNQALPFLVFYSENSQRKSLKLGKRDPVQNWSNLLKCFN